MRIDSSYQAAAEFTSNEYEFTVTEADNGAEFKCAAHSSAFDPVAESVKLRVYCLLREDLVTNIHCYSSTTIDCCRCTAVCAQRYTNSRALRERSRQSASEHHVDDRWTSGGEGYLYRAT